MLPDDISQTYSSPSYIYQTAEIGVRGLSEKELDGNYPNWFLNREVCQFNSHGAFPKSFGDCQKFVASLSGSRSQLVWAVYHQADQKHIGNISLQAIDWIARSAELAFIFGESAYWGKGYAQQAATLLLNHAFSQLNLFRVHCGTAATNVGMNRLAEKLGMEKEGVRRKALYLNGNYVDIYEYGLLRSEFS